MNSREEPALRCSRGCIPSRGDHRYRGPEEVSGQQEEKKDQCGGWNMVSWRESVGSSGQRHGCRRDRGEAGSSCRIL